MDLNLLAAFVTVAETASFSEAARRLRLPKSSVSRRISALESTMGVRLLHRSTRHVALSTAGAALYERVAPQLASLQQSLRDLPELEEEPSGRLRVTATVDWGVTVLAEVVTRFVARYPAVQVELSLSSELVDLVGGGFDVALRISRHRLKDSTLMARSVGPLAMQLYASPSYLARRGTPRTPRDLEEHSFVVFRSLGRLRLEGPTGSAVIDLHGRVMADDMFFVRESVRTGAGVGLLPRFLAESDVTTGALVNVLPRWHTSMTSLWIVTPAARHVPRKVTAFRDMVLDALRDRPLGPPPA
ncbi:MAG: LysR family transcriptional regulator [Myxococcota bacterium]